MTDSSTLREIQTEHGVTGSFKDKPLSEWLMRHNATESSYQQVSKYFNPATEVMGVYLASFFSKITNLVALYMNPPYNTYVLLV